MLLFIIPDERGQRSKGVSIRLVMQLGIMLHGGFKNRAGHSVQRRAHVKAFLPQHDLRRQNLLVAKISR